MKKWRGPINYLNGFQDLFLRFPVTIILLLVLTINALSLQEFFGNQILQLGLGVAALLSAIAELAYERLYYPNKQKRLILYGVSLLLGLLYYIYLYLASRDLETVWQLYSIPGIRTMILLFTLSIVFIWVPSFKDGRPFEQSFLAVFKAFFISLFFSIVLFLGVLFTFLLFEMLITSIGYNWMTNLGIIVFNFFWPTFFLYLIPNDREEELSEQRYEAPKLLSHLISWILAPIMMIYSAIIILYIIINISGDFFNDSLLEPLLLSYAISGWILLILSQTIQRKSVRWFRQSFPILLLVVILFQMIASTFQIFEVGITHGRYLILLFGVASIICGIWYIISKQKLHFFPLVATIAGLIAFVPPIDALSVSVSNQVNRLETTLADNNMLEDDTIVKQESVSEEDQEIILASAGYLLEINALDRVSFISNNFQNSSYSNLYTVFGFDPDNNDYGLGQSPTWVTLSDWNQGRIVVPLEDYDQLIPLYLSSDTRQTKASITSNQEDYLLTINNDMIVEIQNESEEIIDELDFSYVLEEWSLGEEQELSLTEASFEEVGETFKMKLILRDLSQYEDGDYYSDIYLMIGTTE